MTMEDAVESIAAREAGRREVAVGAGVGGWCAAVGRGWVVVPRGHCCWDRGKGVGVIWSSEKGSTEDA